MEKRRIRKYMKVSEDEDSMTYEITIDKITSMNIFELVEIK